MFKKLRSFVRRSINSLISIAGLELVRRGSNREIKEFLPFQETLAEARKTGLEVGDYVDMKYNKPGATQKAIDQMAALGVFRGKIERICEIGPGSGRYLEKTLKACSPTHYEIYETASDWAKYLVQEYKVIFLPTDGMSLSHTPSRSIDLIQAHKVFVATPFLTTCRYFAEIVRVVRDGGKVIFDIVTEDCMDDDTLKKWIVSGIQTVSYPCLMPKQYAVDFFCKRGFSLDGSFFIPMKPGKTECFVFTKLPS
jgi:SAM-dependent methyltransferase